MDREGDEIGRFLRLCIDWVSIMTVYRCSLLGIDIMKWTYSLCPRTYVFCVSLCSVRLAMLDFDNRTPAMY